MNVTKSKFQRVRAMHAGLVLFALLAASPMQAIVLVFTSGTSDAGLEYDHTEAMTIRDASLLVGTSTSGSGGDVQAAGITNIPPQGPTYALLSFDTIFSGSLGSTHIISSGLIDSATLWVYQNVNSGDPGTLTLHGLDNSASDWVESEVSYAAKSSTATGWDGSGGDIDQALVSGNYGTHSYSDQTGWVGIDITNALRAYKEGNISGLVMKSDGDFDANFSFDSKENSSGNGLVLEVDVVPEPAAVGLIAICGSIGIFYRMRRCRATARKAS